MREDEFYYGLRPEWAIRGLVELHSCWVLDFIDIESVRSRMVRVSSAQYRSVNLSVSSVRKTAVMLFIDDLCNDESVLDDLVNRGLVI